jgi:hypothetical protein
MATISYAANAAIHVASRRKRQRRNGCHLKTIHRFFCTLNIGVVRSVIAFGAFQGFSLNLFAMPMHRFFINSFRHIRSEWQNYF